MHCRYRHASGYLNLLKAEALCSESAQLGYFSCIKCRVAWLLSDTGLPDLDTLGKAYAFLPRDGSQETDNSISKQAGAVEVLFSKGLKPYACCRESLQIIKCLGYALAIEAVEAPK